jgi:glycosyltransferase involved in cell wall biosynthesis
LLVPPGDPEALADAIERLDRDTELLAELAAGARAAAPMYTTEAWARALAHGSRTFDRSQWMWTKWRHRRA